MPSISAMIVTGNGTAKSRMTSNSPRRASGVSSRSQLVDAGTDLLERPWGERLRHEFPEPRVVGRIATEHRGLVGLIRVGEPVGDLPRALLGVAGVVPVVGGEPTVAQDGQAVSVAKEEPTADGTAAVDRVALAEALVKWIRPFACLTEEG